MMKVLFALSLLVVGVTADAKTEHIRRLLKKAVPTDNNKLGIRRLDQAAVEQEEAFEVNIATYSIKFEQCQFVKTYSEELAANDQYTTVFETERFVLFRLCPNGDCTTCSYNYGEYLVDLNTYLDSTVEYFKAYQEAMCEACANTCVADDAAAAAGDDAAAAAAGDDAAAAAAEGDAAGGGRRQLGRNKFYNIVPDCTVCAEECDKIENMQNNGFIDATNFLECTLIYDPQDDNKEPLYAGPICASLGTKIKIGVFTDANCINLDESKEVDDFVFVNGVSMSLSNLLLKSTYTDTCISCKEPVEQNENAEGDAAEDADEVIEMCEQLYDEAAKCEKAHGFADGYANYNGYQNQLAEEEVVCEYMASLKAGTYDETGEVIVTGAAGHSKSGKSTTGGQKFALTFFILGTFGLACYAAMLHSKLVKGKKVDLASQGAMA